jgi:hypothetical protein
MAEDNITPTSDTDVSLAELALRQRTCRQELQCALLVLKRAEEEGEWDDPAPAALLVAERALERLYAIEAQIDIWFVRHPQELST